MFMRPEGKRWTDVGGHGRDPLLSLFGRGEKLSLQFPIDVSPRVLRIPLCKFLNQFSTACVYCRWSHHLDFDDLVASGNALATQTKPAAAGSPGWHLDGSLPAV